MTRLVLAIATAFLIASLATAPAAPVPPARKPLLYFPTTEAKWLYRFHGVNDSVGRDVVEVVMCLKAVDGTTHVAMGSVFDGKARGSGEAFIVSPKGLVRGYTAQNGSTVPTAEVLRVPCVADEMWIIKRDQNQADKEQRYTSRGAEDVEVPAGKFHAIRVDVEYIWRNGSPTRKDKTWYGPGIGVVKWEDNEGRSLVLKVFEAGK